MSLLRLGGKILQLLSLSDPSLWGNQVDCGSVEWLMEEELGLLPAAMRGAGKWVLWTLSGFILADTLAAAS